MSSADAVRTLPSPPAAATPAAAPSGTAPNAPNSVCRSGRPIAWLILIVSSVPEAPTSVPPMISAVLSSTNPVEAAASPVNAFRSEITTGMSAPPIGRTNRTPSTSAPTITTASQIPFSVIAVSAIAPASVRPSRAVVRFCAGKTIGRPGTSSWSFPNATRLPQKLTEPTSAEKRIPTSSSPGRLPDSGAIRWNSAAAISAAAPPPDAVEERDHLRDRGHPHHAGRRDADHRADSDPGQDQPVGVDLLDRGR